MQSQGGLDWKCAAGPGMAELWELLHFSLSSTSAAGPLFPVWHTKGSWTEAMSWDLFTLQEWNHTPGNV